MTISMSGLLGTLNNAPPNMLLGLDVPTMEVNFLMNQTCHICMYEVTSYLNIDGNFGFTCSAVFDAV